MRDTFVLDACAMIAFLNDEAGGDVVEKFLQEAKNGEIELIMNKVNLLEIYYGICREDGAETANFILKPIEDLPVKIISSLSDEVFDEAGRLKAENKISLADSIAIAEANVRKIQLITSDHHEFDTLEKSGKTKAHWIR